MYLFIGVPAARGGELRDRLESYDINMDVLTPVTKESGVTQTSKRINVLGREGTNRWYRRTSPKLRDPWQPCRSLHISVLHTYWEGGYYTGPCSRHWPTD